MGPETDRRQKGFTLIEILISLSIFLLVLLGIYELFDWNRATYVSSQRKVDVQQNARAALDEISRQIRMAGYFPEIYDSDGTTNPSLGNPIGLLIGTDTGLVVYGDLNGACDPSQAPCTANSSSVFLYCLSGITVLRKNSTNLTVAASFSCNGGEILAENVTSLQFTYYDSDNVIVPNPAPTPYRLDSQALGAVPTFATTTDRQAVRTVLITLTAREDVPGQPPQVYTLTSSVRLRNL